MEVQTIIIGMIKAAQANDEAAMNMMVLTAQENGMTPGDLLGSALGFITGLLEFLTDEGYPTLQLLQDLAISILTEENL